MKVINNYEAEEDFKTQEIRCASAGVVIKKRTWACEVCICMCAKDPGFSGCIWAVVLSLNHSLL